MISRLLLVFSFLILGVQAHAILIESADYNAQTDKIELVVVYDGGLMDHQFELQWDACSGTAEAKEVAARLVDVTGSDDTGTDLFRQKLEFSLEDDSCRPADVTIISGRYSRKTVRVP